MASTHSAAQINKRENPSEATASNFEASLREGDAHGLARAIAEGARFLDPIARHSHAKNAKDASMLMPLSLAADLAFPDCVRILLAAGADANASCPVFDDHPGPPPLWWAAASRAEAQTSGFNAREHIESQNSFLSAKLECVELLIDAGADVEGGSFGKSVSTPLMHASGWSQDMMTALADKGARVDAVSSCGRTALICAVYEINDGEDCANRLSRLLELGAGQIIDSQDENQRNALWWAARADTDAPSNILISAGAAIDALDDKGQTALHQACHVGCLATVTALLAAGANINAQDSEGISPLMAAAERGHFEIIRKLLGANADILAKDAAGLSCPDRALRSADPAVHEILGAAFAGRERQELRELMPQSTQAKPRRRL